jgi:hypothetical protein
MRTFPVSFSTLGIALNISLATLCSWFLRRMPATLSSPEYFLPIFAYRGSGRITPGQTTAKPLLEQWFAHRGSGRIVMHAF